MKIDPVQATNLVMCQLEYFSGGGAEGMFLGAAELQEVSVCLTCPK